jgi:hypothetical protein
LSGHGYATGLVWLAATAGVLAAGTRALLRGRLAALEGSARAAGAVVVFTAGLVAAHVVPLALGVLARGTVLAAACALALLVLALPARAAALAPPLPREPSTRLAAAIAGVAVAAVAAAWLVALARSAAHPVTALDASTFHLPNVARWIQHGTLWRIDQFVPGLAQGDYPQNGDVVSLAAVLPWRDAFAARLETGAAYAVTGVCVYALAREAGARAAGAALAGALVLAVPIVAIASVRNVMPDAVMYATFAAGLTFLLRHVRGRATADLVLAGVGLGLSFGTKWYAVSAVALVVAVWALGRLVARERLARVARDAALVAVLVAAAGGIWLVRNLVESGDPAFPQAIAPFGITLFGAPPDPIRALAGFRVADYLFDGGVWNDYLLPAYRAFLGAPAALLLAGPLAALAVGRRRIPPRVAGLVVLAAALAIAYVLTPYSAFGPQGRPLFTGANSRYLVPALIVGAAAGAWALERLGRLRVAAELAALAAVVLGLRRGYDVPVGAVVAVGAALLAVVALGRTVRAPLALGAALALVAVALAGARVKERFDARGYHGADPTVDWVLDRAPAGTRIALAGTFDPSAIAPVLPMFGPRLANDVRYAGPWVRHRLEQYATARPFTSALRQGGYQLLLVGRGAPPTTVAAPERWASEAGWVPVARGPAMTLLRAP